MKSYVKPAIEFIELKPEERLACGSSGCCGCTQAQNTQFLKDYNRITAIMDRFQQIKFRKFIG